MGLSIILDNDIEDEFLGKNREHQKLGFVGLGRQFFFLTVWTDKNRLLSVQTVKKLIVDMWGISVLFEPPQPKNEGEKGPFVNGISYDPSK